MNLKYFLQILIVVFAILQYLSLITTTMKSNALLDIQVKYLEFPLDAHFSNNLTSYSTPLLGMKILLIGHNLRFTGAEVFLLSLANILTELGNEIFFYFPFSLTDERVIRSFFELHSQFQCFFKGEQKSKPLSSIRFDLLIANTAEIEATFGIFSIAEDLYIQKDSYSMHSKLVLWIHEFYESKYISNIPIMRVAYKIIFCSNAAQRSWTKRFPDLEKKSEVIYPGISKSRTQGLLAVDVGHNMLRGAWRRRILGKDVTEDDLVLLTVGSISAKKGIYELLKSFQLFAQRFSRSQHQNISLYLVLLGPKDPSEATLGKKIRKINSILKQRIGSTKIFRFGYTSSVDRFYSISDAVILNSFAETFGMVLVEAMLAGKPVISRDCGGPGEIIRNGTNGFLIPKIGRGQQGINNLGDLLYDTISMPKWKSNLIRMGVIGREIAKQRFTYQQMETKISHLLSNFSYQNFS